MNAGYLLFWDARRVQFFRLDEPFLDEKRTGYQQNINLLIDKDQENTIICEIRTGCDKDAIVVIMEQEKNQFTIFSWNLQQNIESDAFDVTAPFEVLSDHRGGFYVAFESKVYFIHEQCCINAFDFQPLGSLDATASTANIGYSKGILFDGKNHNWLIFQEYLSLPFTYMAFVIKNKIEIEDPDQQGNRFDLTPYNYLFNKSNSFLDGNFVQINYVELEYVLQNFERIDPSLLELLNYSQTLEKREPQPAEQQALATETSQRNFLQKMTDYVGQSAFV